MPEAMEVPAAQTAKRINGNNIEWNGCRFAYIESHARDINVASAMIATIGLLSDALNSDRKHIKLRNNLAATFMVDY